MAMARRAFLRREGELGVTVFSTPFDETAVDLLESLGAPAYKIASFELCHHPLLRKVAGTGKPVIMSTGMADLGEIAEAVAVLRTAGCRELVLLHCISAYPAPSDEANLRTIPHLAQTFDLPAGLSDHTLEDAVAVAAVALGASIIEKHFTVRRSEGGPDAGFSLEPSEFSSFAVSVRTGWRAMGEINYARTESSRGNIIYRRSIYAVREIPEGSALTPDNVRVIRPGFGLAPRHYDQVIGRAARTAIAAGTPISWKLIE